MEDRPEARSGARRALARTLSPFSLRAFRILWTGHAVSAAGGGMTRIALVFSVLAVGGTVTDIGLVMAGQVGAQVVFTLVGGVWGDRLRRELVMLTSDVIRAAVQAVLAVLLLTGQAHVWHLAAGAVVFGSAQAFFGPASSGLMAEIVPPDQLQRANALMSSCYSFFNVVSPALAGLAIALVGPGLVLAIDAVTFVVSAVFLGMLRLAPRTVEVTGSFWADLREGWSELAARKWLCLNLVAHMFQNLAVVAYFVLGPVIADQSLGGPSAWGFIAASMAVGAITGGVVALRVEPSRPLLAGNLAFALTALPLLALAVPMPLVVVAVAAFVSGVGGMFLDALWRASMQQLIPGPVLSRVESYDWLISTVAAPIGLALVGPLAIRTGNTSTLVLAAALIIVPLGLTALVPGIRAVRRLSDGRIVGPGQETRPALEPQPVAD
ncbi:MFS transporter [Umezawaea tangerina]|uniref:Putative MFS family arabinose efflux permease n=1 Tax=Umezawaea tangerina TaxID=84725 RepID=A0A2T0TGS1_9PSEU|nr:MFS transporter [Umezawaea tangerina]PRY44823.1 putative MFS family arabinose efflux permease [Umezawaea tangerina]